MRTLLIDGDTFVFTAASAQEYETKWSDWLWTLHADMQAGLHQLDDMIAGIVEGLQADKVIVALTDTLNWRKLVLPSYKFNRVAKRKPVIYAPLREHVQQNYETYMRPTLEGDDVLGILATRIAPDLGERIIVSIDKDFQSIPCRLYNYGKAQKAMLDFPELTHEECLQSITVEQADRFHMLQTLAGDVTDGYPGCPGVGMVNAERLLDAGLVLEPHDHVMKSGPRKGEAEVKWEPGVAGTPWEVVCSVYARAGLSEEVALQNARVARICRASDYRFHEQEVKLWLPPTDQTAA